MEFVVFPTFGSNRTYLRENSVLNTNLLFLLQGSILGPLLFLIYINDMKKAIKNSKTFHFADDTYLKFSCSSEQLIRKKMNEDLKNLII